MTYIFCVLLQAFDDWSHYGEYTQNQQNWSSSLSPAAVAERTTRELTELLPINALPTALQLANAESEDEVEANADQSHLDDAPPSEDLLRRAIAPILGEEVREETTEAAAFSYAAFPDNMPDTAYDPHYQHWSSVPMTPMPTNSPMAMPTNGFILEEAYPRYTQDLPTIVTEDPRVLNSEFSDHFR